MVKLFHVLGSDSACGPGRVRGFYKTILVVLEPRFRRFYKKIFEIVCDMHCIAYKG